MNKLRRRLPRRTFLKSAAVSASAVALAGCDNLSRTEWFPKVLDSVEPVNQALQLPLPPGACRSERIGALTQPSPWERGL